MTQIKNNALRITTESADRSWTGVAAAWADVDMTVPSITSSQNVTSLTDNGAGDGTLNFTNFFSSSSFALSTLTDVGGFRWTSSRSASDARFNWSNSAGTLQDYDYNAVIAHGDLA